jgi:hypothetical protein
MVAKIVENERTAMAQKVSSQPDGPGQRIGKRSVISGILPLVPGGGPMLRERLPQFQAEAPYWEERVGTVHEFHMFLFDNDTKLFSRLFTMATSSHTLTTSRTKLPLGLIIYFRELQTAIKALTPNILVSTSSSRSFSMPRTLRLLAETLRKPCVCATHLSTCWMKHSHDGGQTMTDMNLSIASNVRSESNGKRVSEIHELFKPHKYRVNANMR